MILRDLLGLSDETSELRELMEKANPNCCVHLFSYDT